MVDKKLIPVKALVLEITKQFFDVEHSHDSAVGIQVGNIDLITDDGDTNQDFDEILFSDDDADSLNDVFDDKQSEHVENEKVHSALLSAHQTEVLWKLTKIILLVCCSRNSIELLADGGLKGFIA